ncbi:polyprenyl synthetase [Streptomyces sp. NPDC057411]|uniref:polyprenyl synthetase n=1 Tax=unclassified Streptomyces TaxID=2593676 RepID=UPI0036271B44
MEFTSRGPGMDGKLLLVAAGLAELAVSTAGSTVGTLRHVLCRSDGPELIRSAQQDLMARGRVLLNRVTPAAPAHLEILAGHLVARQDRDGSADDA